MRTLVEIAAFFERMKFEPTVGFSVGWRFTDPWSYTGLCHWYKKGDFLFGFKFLDGFLSNTTIVFRPTSKDNVLIILYDNLPSSFSWFIKAVIDTTRMPLCVGLTWASPIIESYFKTVSPSKKL